MKKDFWKYRYEELFKDNSKFWTFPDKQRLQEQVAFFLHLCPLKRGFLLDFGAGLGFHVDIFNKRGITSIGIEYSKLITKKANKIHGNYFIKQGDMRFFQPNNKCDAITFFDTSFGMFDDKDNQKMLRHCFNLLKADGIIFIDYLNPDWWIYQTEPMIFKPYLKNEQFLKREYSYDKDSFCLIDKSYVYKGKEKIKKYPDQFLKIYPKNILKKMLESTGFHNVKFFGTRNLNYSLKDTSLRKDSIFSVVVAKK